MRVPASSKPYSRYVNESLYLDTHPEEKNIEIPYRVGATFLATCHTPSPNNSRPFSIPSKELRERIRTRHPAELCLEYLPDAGTRGDRQLRLAVTDELRVGEFNNSQVVMVRPTPVVEGQASLPWSAPSSSSDDDDGAVVTAKFYDPLYCDYICFDAWYSADGFYRNEVQAYERLRPLQGVVVPRFRGSYTVDVAVPQEVVRHQRAGPRPVRLILYEHVRGTLLASRRALLYSTRQRQAIMQAVLNAYSKMCQLGVYQLDLRPINIIVLSAEEGREADIRCIDFGDSGVSDPDEKAPTLEPEPRESVVKYWQDEDLTDQMYDFAYFINWPWNEWLRKEYVGPKAGARL